MELTRAQAWLAAFFTLGVFSYLWKENPWYRFCEHTFIALTIAHGLTMNFHQSLVPYTKTYVIKQGWWWFVPLFAIGLLYYTRFPGFFGGKYGWLARYPISISVGWGLGASISRGARPMATQLADVMRPLTNVNNLLFFVFFVCVLMYFFFTFFSKTKTVSTAGRFGRWIMMIGFGVSFGNTINGRISLFLGRLTFLLTQWLGLKL